MNMIEHQIKKAQSIETSDEKTQRQKYSRLMSKFIYVWIDLIEKENNDKMIFC